MPPTRDSRRCICYPVVGEYILHMFLPNWKPQKDSFKDRAVSMATMCKLLQLGTYISDGWGQDVMQKYIKLNQHIT